MKYWLFPILVFFALFTQCRPDIPPGDAPGPSGEDTTKVTVDTPVHVIDLGKGYVRKNGSPWNVPFYAFFRNSNPKTFYIVAGIGSPGISESLHIDHIPIKTGGYKLEYATVKNFSNQIPEAYYGMVYELDQPIGDFHVDTMRHDHFIEVLRYDSIKNTVEGRFQVFLGKAPMSTDWPGVPDSIFFTEGRFHLRIQKP